MTPRPDLACFGDAPLVVAVGRWSADALAEVYRRHGGAVFELARRLLGDQQRAEDVAQEVFLTLWRRPEAFDPARGSLRAFLLTATHSRAIDVLRTDAARRAREARDALHAVRPAYDLEREVADLVVAEQVRAAMTSLPAPQREAIELAYFGAHSYREVAALTGQPEGTVKSRIRGGLARLREALTTAGVTEP